jgi:hypothetical protein
MPELHDLLERRASGYEPSHDLFERVLDRRDRRHRNQRVAAGFLGIAVFALAAIGLVRLLGTGGTPADESSNTFFGEWASPDYNDFVDDTSSQTMTIREGEGGVVHITVHDDVSSGCSEKRPGENPRYVFHGMTMTGTGRLEDPTTLVVPSPLVACVDGGHHGGGQQLPAGSYRLVLDLATDRLYDNFGVVWNRGAPPESWSEPSTEAGADGPETYSILHGEVTFRAAEPWNDHVEAYIDPRVFFLQTGRGGEADMTILVNPLPPKTPCEGYRVLPSAEELVQAVRSNPDLEATAPVTERVGRIDALRMDVVAAPGGSIGPCGVGAVDVVNVPGRPWASVGPGDLGRLYVLDLPGGSARTLAIWIKAPDAASFQQALDAAAPVLDSFGFDLG